jgi:aryl-alcohol dehydrogenase-like predicted oxidoreductase
MNYRRLGHSGFKVSELSFGSRVTYANQLDDRLVRECLVAGFDARADFFDNAAVVQADYAARPAQVVEDAATGIAGA